MDGKIKQDKFPERLKEIRLYRRLSQTDLAKLTGFMPSAISHFECGRRSPRLSSIHLLCSVLLITPNELLGWGKLKKDVTLRIKAGDYEVTITGPEKWAKEQIKKFMARVKANVRGD